MNLGMCNLCPRKCSANRTDGIGFCGVSDKVKVARAALHQWEEPCISGTRGSGAVFFCGCNLKCVFCQNSEISRGGGGKEISPDRLGEIFVELKNSVIDDGTKISHLTYIGDSDVGKNVNFGCGTVTVNYDGINKNRCTIGDNCFIGCNTNLIAPVKLGKGAYTAAGTTITNDVPDFALAIERTPTVIKNEYSLRKMKDKVTR